MHVTRSCGFEYCISDKSIHASLLSWSDRYLKNWRIKSNMLKSEGLVRKHITFIKHINIKWCHMGVIFMPKYQIWKMRQCALILVLIIHSHTENVDCGAVLTVHVLIFLTMKQIKNMKKQHPQLGFTFITSLHVVLLMVELHWNTKNILYV